MTRSLDVNVEGRLVEVVARLRRRIPALGGYGLVKHYDLRQSVPANAVNI